MPVDLKCSLHEYGLLEAFKRGDQVAFKKIYDSYIPRVYSYCRQIMNSSNILNQADEINDIVSSVFYKLFKNRHRIVDYDHLGGYIFKICKNSIIDSYRKNKGRRSIFENSMYLDIADDDDEILLDISVFKQLIFILKRYPSILCGEKTASVFRMYYLEKKTTAEIVAITGNNRQTILNLKGRAIDSIRKHVKLKVDNKEGILYYSPPSKSARSKSVIASRPDLHKPIICKQSNVIYDSIKAAATALRCSVPGICQVLSGLRSHHHGYTFEYVST